MYKVTKTFVDYLGATRTEDFYFNLTQAECLELQLSEHGGMEALLKRIIAAQDVPTIVATFKKIILNSYGDISPDGRRFIKTKELADAFSQTEAYSALFMELSTNADAATKFINAIIPKEDLEKTKTNVQSIHPIQ